MTQGLRYKFNGSSLAVQTALAAGKVISNITAADPGVASSTTHGYTDGDVVKISGLIAPTTLNDKLFVVDGATAGTFELAGTDTSGLDAFVAGSPGTDSIAQKVTFSDFCELTGANQQDGAADQIEVTTICSDAKEFEQGLSDSGTIQLDYNAAPLSTVQTALRNAKVAGSQIAIKIAFPSGGGTIIVIGTVQQQSIQGQVNGVWTGSCTLKLSGPIFVL